MSIPNDFGREMRVDPKMVKEILASPAMSSEQGSGFLSEYGGPVQYQEMARIPVEARMAYYAVQGGASTPGEVEVMTGLSKEEAASGISYLEKRGLVEKTVVTPEDGVEKY